MIKTNAATVKYNMHSTIASIIVRLLIRTIWRDKYAKHVTQFTHKSPTRASFIPNTVAAGNYSCSMQRLNEQALLTWTPFGESHRKLSHASLVCDIFTF